ncbi:MAG: MarR family winged helix-turn-helix transcriptional regulator [Bacteroidia bacterium]|nr:MarR family winged helix-turn-helix transcriptional regulator [Bacteroidia bacterium]
MSATSSELTPRDISQLEQTLVQLHHIFRRHRDHIKKKYQISAVEMDIIQLIIQQGPCKMKHIADTFQLKLSTLTSLVDKAETQGILCRTSQPNDKRVVLLDVTAQGRSIYQDYSAYLTQIARHIQHNFDEDTLQDFIRGVEVITRLTPG